ncbi:MAG: hypothetical protein LBE95_00850 [Holosporaceae bacterium]|jgi:hypothetical protein|nr:hypothetical protein [Holosporaceae bacterium]
MKKRLIFYWGLLGTFSVSEVQPMNFTRQEVRDTLRGECGPRIFDIFREDFPEQLAMPTRSKDKVDRIIKLCDQNPSVKANIAMLCTLNVALRAAEAAPLNP